MVISGKMNMWKYFLSDKLKQKNDFIGGKKKI